MQPPSEDNALPDETRSRLGEYPLLSAVGMLVALQVMLTGLLFVSAVRPFGSFDGVPSSASYAEPSTPLRISEIDGPMIDRQALSVTGEDVLLPLCTTLPLELWGFLLAAYGLLLIFNFLAAARSQGRIFWRSETAYTGLLILGWYAWDGCRTLWWFPWSVLQLGLSLYLLAILLHARQQKTGEHPAQARLPF